mmetsp:Transcript_2295/g.3198  ORF Transcript_2295/g.3198 Transcript_2295/m.3198 type:complete len:289 (+) Transcript_2295:141-1007(+)
MALCPYSSSFHQLFWTETRMQCDALKRCVTYLSQKTSSPHVYMIKGMEEDVMNRDLNIYRSNAQVLDRASCAFLNPSSLGYELPDPEHGVPEFAIVGRSNVGKSTLLGALINNPALVKTSKRPGCTKSINYFGIFNRLPSDPRGTVSVTPKFYLVDLPGYGFAKAAKKEVHQWQRTMEDFLLSRPPDILRRVYVLIDGRHGLKLNDNEMMRKLDESGVPYQLVLTKTDLVKSQKGLRLTVEDMYQSLLQNRNGACMPIVHLVSSKNGFGIQEMKGTICTTAKETRDNI